MWPSPTSLSQTALGPRQQPMTASAPAYEPSRHGSSSSSAGGMMEGKTSIWQYPSAVDGTAEAKLADLWPRRTSGTLPSTWLDDYYNSAVADDDDGDDDSIFVPSHQNYHQQYQQQRQPQQAHPHHVHQKQRSLVQFSPWLRSPLDITAAPAGDDHLPPLAYRSSRLSRPSASFHHMSAQQKAAQSMILQNEQMLRSQMETFQLQQAYHERLASLSSDMAYTRGQGYSVPVHCGSLPLATPSVTAAVDAMAVLSMAEPSPRQVNVLPKDGSSLFSPACPFQEPCASTFQDGQPMKQPQTQLTPSSSSAPTKTFKPMQMVFREGRRASAGSTSTSTSTSSGTGTGTATTAATTDTACSDTLAFQQTSAARRMSSASTSASVSGHYPPPLCPPGHASPPYMTSLASLTSSLATLSAQDSPLPLNEQVFRRQQGISLNYRGDIHNPHNRSDHVPAHLNTSLFLMGLPPQATVGDLLHVVAALGPTGRVFAASVNPPDPARRLPLAAAKISFFTRQQAERLKAHIDAGQLVMYAEAGRALTIRCAWNRDKKPPRQCVQASECRVLRIRGPADVVNFEALTAYFDQKFRYELQDVQVVAAAGAGAPAASAAGEQTMEWRFASFQSQAIAAKMALNQERKMVRVEYGRDPCEWGEC